MTAPTAIRTSTCSLLIASLASLAVPAALAAGAATGELEEVVVTAQKREQPAQDVPLSISVRTGDAVAARSLPDIGALATQIPGVQFTRSDQGGNNAGIYIRGIGQFDWLPTFDPGVGIYIDGVFI